MTYVELVKQEDGRAQTAHENSRHGSVRAKNENRIDKVLPKKIKLPKAVKVKSKKTKAVKAAKKDSARTKGKLGSLAGFSVISVMRRMGQLKWTYEDVTQALRRHRIKARPHTIKRALKRGQKGELRIAPLSKAQLEKL